MSKQVPSSVKILLVAFTAVVISFVGSTLLSERATLGVHDDARSIATNAAPSALHLGTMRTELRHTEILLDDLIDGSLAGQPAPDFAAVNESRRLLELESHLYLELPDYPGEHGLQLSLANLTASLNQAVNQTLALVGKNAPKEALDMLEHTVKPRADALDAAMVRLTRFNVHQAAATAEHIDRVTSSSLWLALGLDAVSVALTVVAAFMAIRAVRRYQALVEERAQELEQFAARVAHDVMSPLSVIGLALDYLKLNGTDDKRARTVMDRARRSLERARSMSDGLLGFARAGARPEAGKTADLPQVVSGVVEELQEAAAENGVELLVDALPAVRVSCSEGLVSSLISNLVRNAIKYIGTGPRRRVNVSATLVDGRARVSVADTGPGLGAGVGLEIFEPYVRGAHASEAGIGLGLATVKRIAEAHGGAVGVKSSDQGCVFWFELPEVSEAAAEPPKMDRPEAGLPA